MRNNILENLELKLLNTRIENSEKLDSIEAKYKKEYWDFFDTFMKNDNSWFRRIVWVSYQLTKLDNFDKSDNYIFKKSLDSALKVLPLNKEKKVLLELKLSKLHLKKDKVSELYIKNSDLHKDFNFPILESFEKFWILTQEDLFNVSLKYKENSNFLEAINVLDSDKIKLIKSHFYELNDTKDQNCISNFEDDFSQEIKISKNIKMYPKVINFIWKNYFRLKLKWKVESKKATLRRLLKIAFLKLYRLKYSWIDINSIIKKLNSLDDLDSMLNLLLKFFEQLKQNPKLTKDYIISEEVDEVRENFTESEKNKENILFLERNTINASSILEAWDKHIWLKNLDNLLWENVDLIGDEFIDREVIEAWIKNESKELEEAEEENEELEEIDLVVYFEELKLKFLELENKKMKLFLDWNYDELDLLNNEILELTIKLEKITKLLWIEN